MPETRYNKAACSAPTGCFVISRLAGLPAAARPPLLLEAIRAVNWLVPTRHERHLSLLATRSAGRGVHLARAAAVSAAATIAIALTVATATAAAAAGLAGLPAGRAARRLISEALL